MKPQYQQNKKYSIIIPAYNSENTIQRCLNSIILQDNNLFEIIIINDGSTDKTLEIIKNYQKINKNIIIINQKNSGPSIARNKGIQKASGKYIFFVDSDDFISDHFFETIEQHLFDDIDILKFNIKYHGNRIDEQKFNTKPFNAKKGENVLCTLIKDDKIFATPWMYIFKKSLFIENNLYFQENCIHEDYGLIPCLIIKAKNMKGIDFIGYHYVCTPNSLSTNQSYQEITRRAFDMLIHYDFLLEFSKTITDKNIKNIFKKYILQNLLRKLKKLNKKELIEFNKQLTLRKIKTNGGKNGQKNIKI